MRKFLFALVAITLAGAAYKQPMTAVAGGLFAIAAALVPDKPYRKIEDEE